MELSDSRIRDGAIVEPYYRNHLYREHIRLDQFLTDPVFSSIEF